MARAYVISRTSHVLRRRIVTDRGGKKRTRHDSPRKLSSDDTAVFIVGHTSRVSGWTEITSKQWKRPVVCVLSIRGSKYSYGL
eukprot:scaffold640974_cov43-Prasinocladus_malaysianus.AAC.1